MKKSVNTVQGVPLMILILLTVLFAGISMSLAADPTAQEVALFNAVRARMMGHAAQMPHGVADVNSSVNPPGCWTQTFQCPQPPFPVGNVTFIVCTELAAWESKEGESDIGAQYIWNLPDVVNNNNQKTITWHNKIMIDADLFDNFENNGTPGQILSEALLYHEFLHGQLGIEWLITGPAILGACQCGIPNPYVFSDKDHTQIPGWQDQYITSLAGLFQASVQIIRQDLPAGGDGSFSVNLGKKDNWAGGTHIPVDGNIGDETLTDPDKNGSMILKGKLKDPKKPGKLIVLVDPEQLFVYGFIHIAPLPLIPLLSTWGIIVLSLLLISIAVFFIYRGRNL
jgi:hypothetical protein